MAGPLLLAAAQVALAAGHHRGRGRERLTRRKTKPGRGQIRERIPWGSLTLRGSGGCIERRALLR
eukprot:4218987-Pyramimonas_sp.AAC.1